MGIEIIGRNDYQGAIVGGTKSYNLYIRSEHGLSGPYITDELETITWETQVRKQKVALVIEGNEIQKVVVQEQTEALTENAAEI